MPSQELVSWSLISIIIKIAGCVGTVRYLTDDLLRATIFQKIKSDADNRWVINTAALSADRLPEYVMYDSVPTEMDIAAKLLLLFLTRPLSLRRFNRVFAS